MRFLIVTVMVRPGVCVRKAYPLVQYMIQTCLKSKTNNTSYLPKEPRNTLARHGYLACANLCSDSALTYATDRVWCGTSDLRLKC
jgi:hypothetical protein